jgi:uncharacterized membrane protein YdbT with pleckstrin-like domain
MHKVYPSAVSTKLAIFLFVCLGGTTAFWLLYRPLPAKGIILLVDVFVAHLFWRTSYTIKENKLIVKSGLIVNTTIDIHAIKKMTPTNSLVSAPALSFDRIEIAYNTYDQIIISPRDKEAFIADLLSINNQIEVPNT